tara:strand:+ start:199 stop:831 length:633 start_codon:yes stop_codon:yes gene_type:complete
MNVLIKRILSSIILFLIAIFFIIKGSFYFIFFLSILFLLSYLEWSNLNKKKYFLKFLGIVFLLFSFYLTYLIREQYGLYFFLFILTICISTDVGGYIFGKILKGPKLTKISPNKTYTGVIGSFLLSLLSGLFFIKYTQINYINEISIKIFFAMILISLISQIGDLIISYFKRKAGLKDTGKILPGHGGLLDRIDGLIFVMPMIYILTFLI